jgi:formylglycine-generating enzyme required for sulfatase activity
LEWTLSVYRGYPYDPEDGREDLEAEGRRVLRGGAFSYGASYVRCACRHWYDPLIRGRFDGFRVVASPVTSEL